MTEQRIDNSSGLTSYQEWQRDEAIPLIQGFYIEDLRKAALSPWKRKGGSGAFINLEGAEGTNDAYLCEIPPGGNLKPQKHLYEELIYILNGNGATTIWNREGNKQTFEWQQGSLFSPPLNAWHQHFNGSGEKPARYLAVTSAPTVFNLLHSREFIFNNSFIFRDRYDGREGYFSARGKIIWKRVWESNFIPDVRVFKLVDMKERGAGGTNIQFSLAENALVAHISEFPVGTYKKAHRHAPGAHVIVLSGTGYSLLWREGQPWIKIDWHEGSMFVPPGRWFHQHFNTGKEPARYMALRWGSSQYGSAKWGGIFEGFRVDESVKEGGDQIEYEDEDPKVRQLYRAELAKNGAPWRMSQFFPQEKETL